MPINKRIAKKRYKRMIHDIYGDMIKKSYKGRGRHRKIKREITDMYIDAVIWDSFVKEG